MWVSLTGAAKVISGVTRVAAGDQSFLKGLIEAGKLRTVIGIDAIHWTRLPRLTGVRRRDTRKVTLSYSSNRRAGRLATDHTDAISERPISHGVRYLKSPSQVHLPHL